MFDPGDYVKIFAPSVGYIKYHLCLTAPSAHAAGQFLWLNSDPTFEGTYNVPCSRVPCIPASSTGFTCFSFGMFPRYNATQLSLYQATKIGVIDRALAGDLCEFVQKTENVDGLNQKERALVRLVLLSLK